MQESDDSDGSPRNVEVTSILKRLEKSLNHIGESARAAEIFGSGDESRTVFQKFEQCFQVLLEHWTADDQYSYMAFQAILPILECYLKIAVKEPVYFSHLVDIAGTSTLLQLLVDCVPRLIDAEMLFGVDTIDILLCTLALHSVVTGDNILAKFITSVPYFNGFYLRKHTKRFEELFTYICSNQNVTYDPSTKSVQITLLRKSSIARRDKFDCQISAGGLVSGIKPSLGLTDIWVSYLDPSLIGLDRMPNDMASKIFKESIRIPSKYRRSPSLHSRTDSFSSDEPETEMYSKLQDYLWEKTENDFLGLQRRLDAFAERNFQINPLVILKVGQILRCLDPTLQCGFFLHIPFNLTHEFVSEYRAQALAVLRGLLGFKQVGFQTSRDCENFVTMVEKYLEGSRVEQKKYWRNNCGYIVYWGDWSTDIGTFPISVKIEAILQIANSEESSLNAKAMKKRILQRCPKAHGCLFLSVERFDYTKGIVERMDAVKEYFRAYPERLGMDVFYQIAAASRGDVSAYKTYQGQVCERVEKINQECSEKLRAEGFENHKWVPIIIDTVNHPQTEVIELYKASCIIVATPVADGMNLVIKEAILSNPAAVYILSTGAGAERQFYDAGLSQCYFRISDITDSAYMAECFHKATLMQPEEIIACGRRLSNFVEQHDIGQWISSYVDPQWTHNMIHRRTCKTMKDLKELLEELQVSRRSALTNLHDVVHLHDSYDLSYRNVLHEIQSLLKDGSNIIELPDESEKLVEMDVTCIIRGLQLDLGFLEIFKRGDGNPVSYLDNFMTTCKLEEQDFKAEFQLVKLFLERVREVNILVLRYEDILISPCAEVKDGVSMNPYEMLQTIACGLLTTHFEGKIAAETQIISNFSRSIMQNLCLTNTELGKLFTPDTFCSDENRKHFQDKTVLMCCCPGHNFEIISWMKESAKKLYLLPVQPETSKGSRDVFTPLPAGAVSAPEVFFGAMATRICSPMNIKL